MRANNKNSDDKIIKNLEIVQYLNINYETNTDKNKMVITIEALKEFHTTFKKLMKEYKFESYLIEEGSFNTVIYVIEEEPFPENVQQVVAKALYNTLFNIEDETVYKLPQAGEVNLLSQSKFNETLDKVFSNNMGVDELDSDTLDFMIQLDTSKLLRYANSKLDKVLDSMSD